MSERLTLFQHRLRRLSCRLLAFIIPLILLLLLIGQVTELGSRNELLSLSTFIVLLSFSALAFNWSLIRPSLTPEKILRQIYQAAIDLFLASMFALVSAFFVWLETLPRVLPPLLGFPFLFLHWLSFLLATLLFLLATFSLLDAVRQIEN